MSKGFSYGHTINLFYPLSEAVSYPESPFVDMVLSVVLPQGGRELRLWLKTDADHPEVEIDARRFTAVGRSAYGKWVDYGRFTEAPDGLGVRRFGIIRFYGMTIEQAGKSWCVLTSQTGIALEGSVVGLEK